MTKEERIKNIEEEVKRIEDKIYDLMKKYTASNDREEGHKIILQENELYDRMRQLKAVIGALKSERVESPLHKLSDIQLDNIVNATTYYVMTWIESTGREVSAQDLVSICNRVLDNLVQFYFDIEE